MRWWSRGLWVGDVLQQSTSSNQSLYPFDTTAIIMQQYEICQQWEGGKMWLISCDQVFMFGLKWFSLWWNGMMRSVTVIYLPWYILFSSSCFVCVGKLVWNGHWWVSTALLWDAGGCFHCFFYFLPNDDNKNKRVSSSFQLKKDILKFTLLLRTRSLVAKSMQVTSFSIALWNWPWAKPLPLIAIPNHSYANSVCIC